MTIYFKDIVEGASYTSSGRTLTEADIVGFAGISGDFNPLHMDDSWVRANTAYDGRIAHGLLVLSITNGLKTQDIDDWAVHAYLNVDRKMVGPAYPGDTIRQVSTVESVRASNSRPGSGVVVVHVQVLNQEDALLQEGRDTYLIGGEVAA